MAPQHVRLLARLKLEAKKNLQINIDIEAMPRDAAYADYILKTIEHRSTCERMLHTASQLRLALLPGASLHIQN